MASPRRGMEARGGADVGRVLSQILCAPLRWARACGSEEGIFSLLTRHLFLVLPAPELGNVTGLLSVVPGGTWSIADEGLFR